MSESAQRAALDVSRLSIQTAKGSRTVAEDVSLSIQPGEMMCIVGESGSGKSVTALSIMGLLQPKELRVVDGSIILDGEDVLTAGSRRLRTLRGTKMAMIFQEPMTALNPVMTIQSQIDEVLTSHTDLSAADRRISVRDMMESVRLHDSRRILQSYPHALSGGQRQRVMIAMALALKPKLLIADEPTTALDVTTQRQILDLIAELQRKQNTAVLFITHDMGVVADIADRVAVMRQGRIVETERVHSILAQPKADYTRQLLASVPSLKPRSKRAEVCGADVLSVAKLKMVYVKRSFTGPSVESLAADEVDLSLKPGRTTGIVGESGSGKSTVARCVMRLITPTSGSIRLSGQEISNASEHQLRPLRRRIQMVFQDPYRSLNPRRTVGETLIEGPRNFGVPRQEAWNAAESLLSLVRLPQDAMNRYPHQFSGGQRQRIAIARALALKPDVLVADEAVSALDVSIQARILELLNEIQQQLNVSLLFVTHDLRVAAQICDTIMVMRGGKVVEHGDAEHILTKPKHDYTRQLIDAVPGRKWDFHSFRPMAEED